MVLDNGCAFLPHHSLSITLAGLYREEKPLLGRPLYADPALLEYSL
jgi:hypothetical protein